MTPSSCALMAEYNRWMNRRLYEAAARLPEADLFADRGAFFGSLFDTLNHIAVGDTIWMQRFGRHPGLGVIAGLLSELPQPTSLRQRLADSLADLGAYREKMDELIVRLAAEVTQEDLATTLRYANTAGHAQARNFGALLQHFFNHQTHHRGQATTLLFQAGVDVGVTDLVAIVPSEM